MRLAKGQIKPVLNKVTPTCDWMSFDLQMIFRLSLTFCPWEDKAACSLLDYTNGKNPVLKLHTSPSGCRVTDVSLHAAVAVGGFTVQSCKWWCNPSHTNTNTYMQYKWPVQELSHFFWSEWALHKKPKKRLWQQTSSSRPLVLQTKLPRLKRFHPVSVVSR